MDDFTISNLYSSRDEWCARLVSILTPLVIEGIKSIFNESWKLAVETNEAAKYLMVFQNMLCKVPKWNATIVEEEKKRIVERSACGYLEDLITCVHIIQLKVLTSVRVGNKQKKIDISIPKLDTFIHKIYIHSARKIYSNVYLFEKNISPLQVQKNNRELEILIQECILTTIRESIPTESIIRAYLDESVEQEEEVIIEPVVPDKPETKDADADADVEVEIPKEDPPPEIVPSIQNIDTSPVITRLTFNDIDKAMNVDGKEEVVEAPKTIERLEEISTARALQRKLEEEDDDDDALSKIKITDDEIKLDDLVDMSGGGDDNISLDFEELK
jgi:hypothetical protein